MITTMHKKRMCGLMVNGMRAQTSEGLARPETSANVGIKSQKHLCIEDTIVQGSDPSVPRTPLWRNVGRPSRLSRTSEKAESEA